MTLAVLHHRYLYLRRRGYPSPLTSGRFSFERLGFLGTDCAPAVLVDQVICPAPFGLVAVHPRNPQLLPLLHDRPSLRTAQLHQSRRRICPRAIRRVGSGSASFEHPFPADRSLGRLLVYWSARRDGSNTSRIWLGCMGHVDASGGLVCVVAGLVDRLCTTGVVHVLRMSPYSHLPQDDSNLVYMRKYKNRKQYSSRPERPPDSFIIDQCDQELVRRHETTKFMQPRHPCQRPRSNDRAG